jgi:peptidyl-prolyl cis-trans isomerase D
MSTLEQIRQRPILIISILGLALLLFILTAVDRPGELFTDSHTVAKIDGEKIDYMEFQKRVEQQQEQLQQRGYTNVDVAQVQEYVLQQMVNETLMEKEYKRLGLVVTGNARHNTPPICQPDGAEHGHPLSADVPRRSLQPH